MREAAGNGKVESGTIGARLATGNYRNICENSHRACCVGASAEAKIEHLLYDATAILTMADETRHSKYATTCQFLLAGYLVLLVVATHLPRGTPFLPSHFNYVDKFCHFAAYALLAALLATTWQLAAGALTIRHLSLAWAAVAVLGALDELTQLLVGRDCELLDWIADVTGAAIGLLVFACLRRFFAVRTTELETRSST